MQNSGGSGSSKQQATSSYNLRLKAPSHKHQAASIKHQEIREKILNLQATSNKHLDF
jgi:hypothetical protein